MKVTVELEKEDFDVLHDVVLEVTDYEYSNEELQTVWDNLPEDIKGTAIQWGTNDTVFRDNMYEHLENKLKK
jgi:hypothetical protein